MVNSFYSVDRKKYYKVGETLNLMKIDPLKRPYWKLPGWLSEQDLKQHLYDLFPDGLSFHGWQYLLDRHDFIKSASGAPFVDHAFTVELLFENIRRAFFSTMPSRFQSFFAWEKVEEAKRFKKPDFKIYRLECSEFFKADQNYLTVGVQNIECSFCAFQYWSGKCTNTPKWEVLLKPPVFIAELLE